MSGIFQGEENSRDGDRLTVFISYSRSDQAFADRLVLALEARAFTVLIDRRDLPFGEKIKAELLDFVRRAHAVIFIVSPASIGSLWCKWEIAQVTAESKRLVPIVLEPVQDDQLPAQIGELNLLPFEDSAVFESQIGILTNVLSGDSKWIKEHTRLSLLGRRWSDNLETDPLKARDSLLRGGELDEAELWILRRPRHAPEPTALHHAFILESRRAEHERVGLEKQQVDKTRRFQRRASWALGAVILLVAAAILATLQQSRSTFQRESNVFLQLSSDAANNRFYDRALRYAVAGLPPQKGAWSLLMPWSSKLEAQITSSALQSQLESQLVGHTSNLNSAEFSPDGRFVVTAGDQTARIWLSSNGKQIAVLSGHTDRVRSASFNPTATRILTASDDGTVRIWDGITGHQFMALIAGKGFPVHSAHFSKDGSRVVTAAGKTARVWDANTGALVSEFSSHEDEVWNAEFSPDGRRVVTSCASMALLMDFNVRVWDVETGKLVSSVSNRSTTNSVTFSPDGSKVLTASADEAARIWDANTGVLVAELLGHSGPVRTALFSPDGTRVVTASSDGTARLWDVKGGPALMVFRGHAGAVLKAKFAYGGEVVATASEDGTARVWSVASGSSVADLVGHTGMVTDVSFNADGSSVVTASDDATARIWRSRPVTLAAVMPGHEDGARSATFSPDGTRALTIAGDNTVRLWNAQTGVLLIAIKGVAGPRKSFASFNFDGSLFIYGSPDGTARVVSVAGGKNILTIEARERSATAANVPVTSAVFGPNDNQILTTSADGVARIWQGETGALLLELLHETGPIVDAGFSPDGSRIVTISSDNTAACWDAADGKLIALFRGHTDIIRSAVFSPDGTRVATASVDGTARIWDARSGNVLFVLSPNRGWVTAAAFSPDGSHLAIVSQNETAGIWNALTGALLVELDDDRGGLVVDAAFSPDGRTVVTAVFDPTNLTGPGRDEVRLWDVNSGNLVGQLKGHARTVRSAVFNAAGSQLLTASDDGSVRVWNVDATRFHGQELLENVCRGKLIGAQAFRMQELKMPVLTGFNNANVCQRNGPFSLGYWTAFAADLGLLP
ncbi:TIR domain-containing protein [Mesorhizobium sp. AR02]|uniref:TIR domain-containing protein n=1 Tax=Mesorhizobium sp. AR02 TaxID=2865837 RepID=UPI00215F12E2|nr:TIR domain-containing protein [Mesorhizobium sp. AR02]UVK55357.1 TIR domain-containing protein [Mesorhizobium sp. AR02]